MQLKIKGSSGSSKKQYKKRNTEDPRGYISRALLLLSKGSRGSSELKLTEYQ